MNRVEFFVSAARRIDLPFEPDIALGAALVRPSLREVLIGGHRETLEPRVMQVLVALSRMVGETVTRDDLIRLCWDDRIVSDDAINRAISKLRGLSRLDDGASFRIETLPRLGYRLFAEAAPAAAPDDPPGEAAAGLSFGALLKSRAAPRGRRVAIAAASAVLVSLAGGWAATIGWAEANAKPASVAVLPFADLTRDQSCVFFGQGVAEEIALMLAADSDLRVAGRTSSAALGARASHRDVRQLLGVSHILEGSVRRRGERVRVTARLLAASDGMQVWAKDYDRGLDDVIETQRDIGTEVARAVLARPQMAQLALPPKTDGETYRLFLTARGMLEQRELTRSLSAQRLLRQVVARDPGYAPGRQWLAAANAAVRAHRGI